MTLGFIFELFVRQFDIWINQNPWWTEGTYSRIVILLAAGKMAKKNRMGISMFVGGIRWIHIVVEMFVCWASLNWASHNSAINSHWTITTTNHRSGEMARMAKPIKKEQNNRKFINRPISNQTNLPSSICGVIIANYLSLFGGECLVVWAPLHPLVLCGLW